jgi:hypothetical protein
MSILPDVVYVLCAPTSLACAVLLWRGWRRSRARLLFWSSLCFFGLFLNNLLLIIDVRVLPQVDLAFVRLVPALLGAGALVYGLVWDTE